MEESTPAVGSFKLQISGVQAGGVPKIISESALRTLEEPAPAHLWTRPGVQGQMNLTTLLPKAYPDLASSSQTNSAASLGAPVDTAVSRFPRRR
jgi:hypothetical protein